MAEGIEATLARAAQLADRVLSMGYSDHDPFASVDHECLIDEAIDVLVAIIECRKDLGISPYWDWQKSKAPEVCDECGERIPADNDAVWHYHPGVVIGGGADGR